MNSPAPAPASVTPASAAARRRAGAAWGWLLLPLLLALVAWAVWRGWQTQQAAQRAHAAEITQRLSAVEARLASLRTAQRAQSQRLQQAEATNRVLRDELLGVGQRAALLEDSVARLADPDRSGAQALRLDEIELLLGQGEQRLRLAGDLDGARRAYALAAGLLDGMLDPAYLDLRQTLAQERAALDALGIDPRVTAAARLEAFAREVAALPAPAVDDSGAEPQPWWRRTLSQIVSARPSAGAVAVEAGDRAAALAALQLELSLARASAERRDAVGYRGALTRADGWLRRLWPANSPTLRAQRAQLQALRALPLSIAAPTLGSTLQQLRARRSAG